MNSPRLRDELPIVDVYYYEAGDLDSLQSSEPDSIDCNRWLTANPMTTVEDTGPLVQPYHRLLAHYIARNRAACIQHITDNNPMISVPLQVFASPETAEVLTSLGLQDTMIDF